MKKFIIAMTAIVLSQIAIAGPALTVGEFTQVADLNESVPFAKLMPFQTPRFAECGYSLTEMMKKSMTIEKSVTRSDAPAHVDLAKAIKDLATRKSLENDLENYDRILKQKFTKLLRDTPGAVSSDGKVNFAQVADKLALQPDAQGKALARDIKSRLAAKAPYDAKGLQPVATILKSCGISHDAVESSNDFSAFFKKISLRSRLAEMMQPNALPSLSSPLNEVAQH